jgi:hypothetical protein
MKGDLINNLQDDKEKQQIAALPSLEADATTAGNTLTNGATISHVNVFSSPTESQTSITT